jgi:hypothetical protein
MDDRKERNSWEIGPADGVETPRAEPEIIPPGAPDPRETRARSHIWIAVEETPEGRRIHVRKPGPLTIVLTLLAIGLFTAAALVLFLGLFLLWLPVAGVLVAAAVVTALLRGPSRRVRRF